MGDNDKTALVEGPPVAVSRATLAVVTAVVVSILGSGGTTLALRPANYVSQQELELALERHSAKPHDVTAALVRDQTRDAEDKAVQRAIEALNRRFDGLEELIKGQDGRTSLKIDDFEKRIRALESGHRPRRNE